jgi:hypothetical protein
MNFFQQPPQKRTHPKKALPPPPKKATNEIKELPKTQDSLVSLQPKDIYAGLRIKIADDKPPVVYYEQHLYEIYVDGRNKNGTRTGIPYTTNIDTFALAVKNALNSFWKSKTAILIIRTLQMAQEKTPGEDYCLIQPTTQAEEGSRQLLLGAFWNTSGSEKINTEKGIFGDAYIALIHELAHSYRWLIGKGKEDDGKFLDNDNLLKKEEEETSHLENKIRAETGRPLRTAYSLPIIRGGKRIYGEGKEKNWDYRANANK